jgi:hypothetical protein
MSNILLFDKILTHAKVNHRIIANTYLHVHNAHPELLKKYKLTRFEKYLLSIKFKLIFITKVFQSLIDNRHFYSQKKRVKSNVLFISHLTNNQQIYKDFDPYFGILPNKLLKRDIVSSIVLLNHTGIRNKKALSGWKNSKISRFVLSTSLSFWEEIKLYYSQKKSKKELKFILKDLNIENFSKKDILQRHLSYGTINSLRIALQVASIIQKTGAKFIVTTYEGHAWERLIYYYARKVDPNIQCFGYQHAAVFKHQHAIKRLLSNQFNPDIILTSGQVSKSIFEKSQMKNVRILCLGSPKATSPSAMVLKLKSCLVIPEGFVSECLALFKFSLSYAKQNKDQKFIWRLHPMLNFSMLQSYSDIFKKIPDNIHLSKQSLADDIKKCDSVLYRGSTAVIDAINKGLRPIYYQKSLDELSIDPIYQQPDREIVSNQVDLGRSLNKVVDFDTTNRMISFAQNFYTPLNVECFAELCIDNDKK